MSIPLISVIIPAWNSAKTIGTCLTSVFAQKDVNLEVIVVDDGSVDNLFEVITPWNNKIQFSRQENQGAPSARNAGFKISRGEYVIFCDADIVMEPDCLVKMLRVLEANFLAAYAYCSFRFGWKKFKLFPFSAERLKKMPFVHTTSLIRREFFPGFDESLKKFQDWDLWLTILEKGGHGIWIPEYLYQAQMGGTISTWLPSFVYKLPFIKSKSIEKYRQAEKIIKTKHHLN